MDYPTFKFCPQCHFYAPNKLTGCGRFNNPIECPMRLIQGVLTDFPNNHNTYCIVPTTDNLKDIVDILTLLDGLETSLALED